MKKLILLVLSLAMLVCLCACGSGNEKGNSNETELTLENYATYLNLGSTTLFTGKDWLMKPADAPNSISCNSKAECKVDVSGASSNYDYVNVVLTVKVSGTYDTFSGFDKTEDVAFSEEVVITCDIGGSGSGRVVAFEGIEKSYQIIENSIEYELEVISISGTANRIG